MLKVILVLTTFTKKIVTWKIGDGGEKQDGTPWREQLKNAPKDTFFHQFR